MFYSYKRSEVMVLKWTDSIKLKRKGSNEVKLKMFLNCCWWWLGDWQLNHKSIFVERYSRRKVFDSTSKPGAAREGLLTSSLPFIIMKRANISHNN